MSLLVTTAQIEILQFIPCIYYPVLFRQKLVQVLINSGSEINVMSPVYIEKLGLWVRKTNISAQKINSITLIIHGMVVTNFSLKDKYGRDRFFEDIFLVANTSIEIVLDMPFFSLFNANIRFA